MTRKHEWQLIALAFAFLILGIFFVADVQKIIGIVLVGIAAVIIIPVRWMHDSFR